MDIKEKAKDELEHRLKDVEEFIANRGLGSKALKKARKTQRNVNMAIAMGSFITVAGIVVWAFSGRED